MSESGQGGKVGGDFSFGMLARLQGMVDRLGASTGGDGAVVDPQQQQYNELPGSYEQSEITSSLTNEQNRREYEVDIGELNYENYIAEFLAPQAAVSESEFGQRNNYEHNNGLEFNFNKTCNTNWRELPENNSQMLIDLARRTQMRCSQENGQRRFGPRVDYLGGPPPKGSEVFIGRIPRDCFEPELYPVLEKVGQVYDIRLIMDYFGSNRGYCFVQYYTPEEAQRAIKELNNYEIRKGYFLCADLSIDNCRLFIAGIPKDKSVEDIFQEMIRLTSDVVEVAIYPSIRNKTLNRGFVYVVYKTHRAASLARTKLIPGDIPMFGCKIAVDWAEPEPEVKILYVGNLSAETTQMTLFNLLNENSDNSVERVRKIKNFAFVHFSSREKAEMAKLALTQVETIVDGSKIEINWAKTPYVKCPSVTTIRLDGKRSYPHYNRSQRPSSSYSAGNFANNYGSSIMMSPNGSSYQPSFYPGPPLSYSCINNGSSPNNYNLFTTLTNSGDTPTNYNATFNHGNTRSNYTPAFDNGNSSTNCTVLNIENSPSNYHSTFNTTGNVQANYIDFNTEISPSNPYPGFNNENSSSLVTSNTFSPGVLPPVPSYYSYLHNQNSPINYNIFNSVHSPSTYTFNTANYSFNLENSPSTSYNINDRSLNVHNVGYTGVYRTGHNTNNNNMNNGPGIMPSITTTTTINNNNNDSRFAFLQPQSQLDGAGNQYNTLRNQFFLN